MRVRSLIGLMPLLVVETIEPALLDATVREFVSGQIPFNRHPLKATRRVAMACSVRMAQRWLWLLSFSRRLRLRR